MGGGRGESRGREKVVVSLMGVPGEDKGARLTCPRVVGFEANAARIWVGNGSQRQKKQTLVQLLPRVGPQFLSV